MHEYVVFELNDSYGSDHWIEAKIICFSAFTLRHIILASPQCSLVSSFYNMTDNDYMSVYNNEKRLKHT